MKFTKKPAIVDAIQFNGKNGKEVLEWASETSIENPNDDTAITSFDTDMVIETLEGCMSVREGDWVIRGVKGELYPCKPDIFEKTYEKTDTN